MRAAASERIAVIVAATNARSTVTASLAAFFAELGDRGTLVLVDASRDGTADRAEMLFPGLTVLRRPYGTLAPMLWRDGLRATDEPLVVFSTANMAPRPGWLDALVAGLRDASVAAAGGPIVPDEALGWFDRAIYLNRYVNYWTLAPQGTGAEPAGDNAIYRRASLAGLERLIDRGFWEAAIHRRLRSGGHAFAACPRAIVSYLGGTDARTILPRRFAHARHYAADRAASWSGAQRIARAAATPLVPPLLMARAVRGLMRHGERHGHWLAACASLPPIVAAWALGEAVGTLLGAGSRPASSADTNPGQSAAARRATRTPRPAHAEASR